MGDPAAGLELGTRAIAVQQKTGHPVQFDERGGICASLRAWRVRRGGSADDHAFPSRANRTHHVSTRQYARLVSEWVTAAGVGRSGTCAQDVRPKGADELLPMISLDHFLQSGECIPAIHAVPPGVLSLGADIRILIRS